MFLANIVKAGDRGKIQQNKGEKTNKQTNEHLALND